MARHRRARLKATIAGVAMGLVLLAAPAAHAAPAIPQAAAPQAQAAPLNPAFVHWQAASDLAPALKAIGLSRLARIPSPVIGYTSAVPAAAEGVVALPAGYDLRAQGKLTAVRDQGAYGTCWAFASIGSLESSSLPGETLDLSEDNMALASGFDVGGASTALQRYDAGGNADMATAYLVRWSGAVLESADAYGDGVTPAGATAARHVQNVDMWTGRTAATDNDRIKTAVYTYGGVDVSMLWDSSAYNTTTHSYCYTGTGFPNHDVVVVGWNDDYAASNFTPAAAGSGAFIVRNSWGTTAWPQSESGYFYVSYYDSRFARQFTESGVTYSNDAYTFEAAQPATNYGAIYQYDPLGVTGYIGYGAGAPAWGAALYTASADSQLSAVGFYALAPNTAYEVYEGPSLAGLTRLTTGTMAQMGYHTVDLPAGTTLTQGSTFVVAVKLTTPGWSWPIAYESRIANYTDSATASPGQTYFSSSGTSWTDMNTQKANASVCLKAYASAGPTSSSSYSFAANATSGWKTTAQTVTITASGGSGTGRTIYYSQDGGATWGTSAAASVDVGVSSQGSHSFKYYCKDSLATEATHSPGWVNIDSVAPSTTDDHLTASLAVPATITLIPSDATSGVEWTQYKVDGAASYVTGTSIVLSTPGSHTVAYRSMDNAGNVESPDKTFTVTVTAAPPASATAFTGFAADAASGWFTSPQSVRLTASGGSGSGRTIHYSVDGGSTWSAAVADAVDVAVSSQGAHHVEYYASDSLAIETTHDAGWVNIDSVAPSTIDDHPTSGALGPLTVTLTAQDATSGMSGGSARTEYRVDSAAAYTLGTRVLLTEGLHTVVYRSTDKAGNRESPDKTFTVTVMGPSAPVTACDYTFSPSAASGWHKTAQQFTVSVAGGRGTGRQIHYSLDGGVTWDSSPAASADVPVADGAHHVQYYADDSLAVEPTHDAGWINVDTGVPSTKAARASVRRGVRVALRYRVTDATPGCGKAALKLQIRKRSKVVKTIALGVKATNVALKYRYRARLKRGTYTWRVLATDLAGNVAVKRTAGRLVIR